MSLHRVSAAWVALGAAPALPCSSAQTPPRCPVSECSGGGHTAVSCSPRGAVDEAARQPKPAAKEMEVPQALLV